MQFNFAWISLWTPWSPANVFSPIWLGEIYNYADSIPWLQWISMVISETEDGHFDPETYQFHNVFEFLKHRLSNSFPEF